MPAESELRIAIIISHSHLDLEEALLASLSVAHHCLKHRDVLGSSTTPHGKDWEGTGDFHCRMRRVGLCQLA
jgi:hypothetical protein